MKHIRVCSVMVTSDHNMTGSENGENNSESTLKKTTCANGQSREWIKTVNDKMCCVY